MITSEHLLSIEQNLLANVGAKVTIMRSPYTGGEHAFLAQSDIGEAGGDSVEDALIALSDKIAGDMEDEAPVDEDADDGIL